MTLERCRWCRSGVFIDNVRHVSYSMFHVSFFIVFIGDFKVMFAEYEFDHNIG